MRLLLLQLKKCSGGWGWIQTKFNKKPSWKPSLCMLPYKSIKNKRMLSAQNVRGFKGAGEPLWNMNMSPPLLTSDSSQLALARWPEFTFTLVHLRHRPIPAWGPPPSHAGTLSQGDTTCTSHWWAALQLYHKCHRHDHHTERKWEHLCTEDPRQPSASSSIPSSMETEITSIPYPSYAISHGQKGAPEAGETAH